MVVIYLVFIEFIFFNIVIVRVVFLIGFVFVFNLLNIIKEFVVMFCNIDIIFVIWDENVDRFCLIFCLFFIFVNILLYIYILFL